MFLRIVCQKEKGYRKWPILLYNFKLNCNCFLISSLAIHWNSSCSLMYSSFSYRTNIMSLSTIQKEFEKFFDQSTEEIRASYGHVAIDRFQKRAKNSRMSSDITEVIDVMEHALLSQHPKTRYVPRLAEHIAVNILTTIPYSMREYVLSRIYK